MTRITVKRKILTLILLIMTLATMVCILSVTSFANESKPSLSINKFNLVFEDNVYLKYAVKLDGVDDDNVNSSNIGMLYFTEPQSDYIKGNEDFASGVVGHTTIDGAKHYTFEYRKISAKQMTDYIYSVAYLELDGEIYYSAPAKYSVLEYAYSKLGKTGKASDNDDFKSLLTATLEQGAAAQKYFKYNTDRLANDEYYMVEVIGGVLEDGFTSGLYHNGQTATLTTTYSDDQLICESWLNSAGNTVSHERSFKLTEFSANETYTITNYVNHTSVIDDPVAPTCTEQGLTQGAHCSECGETLIAQQPIAAAHSYSAAIVIPTATDDGFTEHTCTSCGDTYRDSYITPVDFGVNSLNRASVGFTGVSGESLSIPAVFEENGQWYRVTSITVQAFYGTELSSVRIPESVTKICGSAFRYCSNLSSVEIPDSVTVIDDQAFAECRKLSSIKIPGSVTSIGIGVFASSGLKEITVSPENKSYTSIDGNLFSADKKTLIQYATGKTDKSYSIPDTVTCIANRAFSGNFYLKELSIPDSITYVSPNAFFGTNFTYNTSDDINYLGNANNPYLILVKATDTSITSCIVESSTRIIYDNAFYGCNNLENAYYLGTEESFSKILIDTGNYRLTDANMYYYSESRPTTEGSFWHYNENGEIEIWDKYVAPTHSQGLAYVDMGDGTCHVSGIGSCKDDILIIPSEHNGLTVSGIAIRAFYENKTLKEVIIPDSVTVIGDEAFAFSPNITKVYIGTGVTKIGYKNFTHCYALTDIHIMGDITYIGFDAFRNCTALKEFTIPETVTEIDSCAFSYSGLESIVIPASVTAFSGNYGQHFANCRKLTTVVFEEGCAITKITTSMFSYCTSLTEIAIPSTVKSIGNSAFYYCTSLEEIIIPYATTSIGSGAFGGCNNLVTAVFKNNSGWRYSSSSTSSGTAISYSDLYSPTTAANYLTSTYSDKYWTRK
ncbi:MAG: leucine-rich repeat domain-containing protein [Clostridia bacterium]|nr:leucine-rich repeat domain-containing protein [Clostridia bacterium]